MEFEPEEVEPVQPMPDKDAERWDKAGIVSGLRAGAGALAGSQLEELGDAYKRQPDIDADAVERGRRLAETTGITPTGYLGTLPVLPDAAKRLPTEDYGALTEYYKNEQVKRNQERGARYSDMAQSLYEGAREDYPIEKIIAENQEKGRKAAEMKDGHAKAFVVGGRNFLNRVVFPYMVGVDDKENSKGNQEAMLRLVHYLDDVQAQNTESASGLQKHTREAAGQVAAMTPGFIAAALRFVPVAGPALSAAVGLISNGAWALHGATETLEDVEAQGGDLRKALGTSILAGMVYDRIEAMQVEGIATLGLGKTAKRSVGKTATSIAGNAIKEWFKNMGEEGMQGATVVDAAAQALRAQGYDISTADIVKSMKERFGEEAVGSAWSMAVIVGAGSAVGAGRAAVNLASRNTRLNNAVARENAETIRQSKQDFDAMDAGTYQPSTQAQAAQQGATARVAPTEEGEGQDTPFAGRGVDGAETRENATEIDDNEAGAADPDAERANTRNSEVETEKPETGKELLSKDEPKDSGNSVTFTSGGGDFRAKYDPQAQPPKQGTTARDTPTETGKPETGTAKATEDAVLEYQESTDENLVNFAQNIKDGVFKDPSNQNYSLGKVSDRAVTDIDNLTGIDVSEFKHNITGNAIEHIDVRHGANGNQDHSMADINDFGRIKYVLDNYDEVKFLYDKDGNIERSYHYKDSENNPSPKIRYKKRVNGNFYVVEAVPDASAKKLQVVSAYKEKTRGRQEADDTDAAPPHVRNALAPSPNNIEINRARKPDATKVNSQPRALTSETASASNLENEPTRKHDGIEAPKHNVQNDSAYDSETLDNKINDLPEKVNSEDEESQKSFEGEDGDSDDLRFARRTVSPAERERRGTWIDQALKMTESKPENAIIGTAFRGLTEGKSAYKELLSKDEMNTLHLKKIRLDTLPKDSGNRVTFTSGGVDFSAKYDPEEKTWDVRRDARYSVTMPEDAGIYVDKTKIEILEWQKKALERKLAGMEKRLLNSRLALEQSIDNLEDKLKGRYEERIARVRGNALTDTAESRFRKKMAEDRLKVAENDLKAADDNLTGRRKYVKQVQSEIYKYAKSLGLKELPSDWARILIEHKPLEELGHSTLRELREATHKLDVMWYEQEGKRLGEKIENIAANEYIRQKGLHNKRASTVDLEANRKIWDMLENLRKRDMLANRDDMDDGYADAELLRWQETIDNALKYYQMYGGSNIRNNRNYDLAGIPKTDRKGKPTEYREEMIEWIEGRSGIPKFLKRAIKSQFTQNIKYMTNEEKNSWLMDFKDIKSDGVTRRERQIREEKEEHEKQVEAILGVLNNVWGEAENVEAWANFMEEPKPKSPRKINADFNRKLRQQIDGTLRAGYVYDLGNPGAILRAAGVDDLPIELESRVLSKKSSEGYHGNHPFDISQIMNLPNAINNPIAIFDDDSGADGGKRILTELHYKGVNFVVAMRVRTDKKSRKTMATVNSIRTIFPKDRVSDVFDWFYGKNDLLRWVDKEKARRFVSIHSTDRNADGNESRAIDKVMAKINGFENPKSATGQASKQRSDSAEVGDNPDRTNNNISDSEEKVNTQDKKNNIGWFKTLGLKKGLRNLGMIFDNTRPELIIRRLEDSVGKDEAGAIFEYLFKPEIRAENKFLGKYIKEADEAIADIHADLKLAFLRDEELLTIRMQNGGKRVVTYNAAMAVYAHSKNPHNRAHLSGTGFTDEQIEEICAALPQEYRDAVEKTRLYMSAEIFPKVSEMYAKEHQVDMRPEEDYWPIRDLDFAGLGGVTATMEEMASRHESQRANLNKGMTKTRTNSDAAFRQLDYMGTLLTSVRDALYTVAFNDAITQANKLLGDKRIVAALNRISPDVVPALRQHYKDVANMRRHPEDGGDSTSKEIFPTVMRNLAIASMGYNLSTIVKQYVAVPQGMAVMDSPKSALYVAQVLAEWMKSPKALREFVYERSPLVANRATNREREFLEMAESGRADKVIKMKLLQKLKSSGLDTKYKVAEVHRAIQEHSMLGAQFGDMLSAITLWKARYNQIMDRTGGNEERAIEDADALIRRTQSQGGIIHLPETFRSRNPFERSFTMFMNQPNQVFNMLIDTICGAKNRGVWKTAYRALMAHVAPSMLLYFITKGRLAPDEPEELIDIAVEDALGGVIFWGWFPTASASAVSNWIRYARGREYELPMGSLISPTLEEFGRLEEILENPKKWGEIKTIETMARVAGLPVNQPKRTYKAIKKGAKAVEDEDWGGMADAATRRQWLSDYALRDKGVFAAMAKRANKAPATDDFKQYNDWYVNKITIAEQEKFENYYLDWLDNMANADRNEEFRLVLSNVKARNPRRALWAMSRLGNWGYSTKDKFKEWYSDKERDKAEKSAEVKKTEAENYKKVVEALQGMGSIP